MAAPTRPNPAIEALGWEIQPTSTNLVSLEFLGRYPIRVQPPLADPILAMEAVLVAAGYENPCDFVGSWMYRAIAGTGGLASAHAYAVAIDADYGGDTDGDGDPTIDSNPHLHDRIVPGDPRFGVEFQFTEYQIRLIEAIRNVDGEQIWRWLGWPIGDTMHFEPLVGPDDCVVDWTTVYQGGEEEMATYEDFRSDEFDLWTDENIVAAYDAGMFEDPNRAGFVDYWVVHRDERTPAEKARFMTDYYAHLWKRS